MRSKGAHAKVVPSGVAVPVCAREAKRVRRGAQSCIHGRGSRRGARSYIHGPATGVEHEAKQSTKLYLWVDNRREGQMCIHRHPEVYY